jgi:hypothetical protein
MGNQQSSTNKNRVEISLKFRFDEQLRIWRVIFCVDSIEFDNPFDVVYFDAKPDGLEIIQHRYMKEVKRIEITCQNASTRTIWIYMDDANPRSFQVLPVARTGRRLRNHLTKFYICDRIEGTTKWVITFFQVRDINGSLATPQVEDNFVIFSTGCWITERSIIDTGSIKIPELEYNSSSNEIQLIKRIELGIIYLIMDNHLRPQIIQTMPQLINSQLNK